MQNIHLIALCYTEDIKKYGFGKVLEPFVKDINTLSTEGIQLPDRRRKKGTITQFSGDNLGVHSLFGFVESFAATYYCGICVASNEEAQHCFVEDEDVLRSKESYDRHMD